MKKNFFLCLFVTFVSVFMTFQQLKERVNMETKLQ